MTPPTWLDGREDRIRLFREAMRGSIDDDGRALNVELVLPKAGLVPASKLAASEERAMEHAKVADQARKRMMEAEDKLRSARDTQSLINEEKLQALTDLSTTREALARLLQAARPYLDKAAPHEQLFKAEDYHNFNELTEAVNCAAALLPQEEG